MSIRQFGGNAWAMVRVIVAICVWFPFVQKHFKEKLNRKLRWILEWCERYSLILRFPRQMSTFTCSASQRPFKRNENSSEKNLAQLTFTTIQLCAIIEKKLDFPCRNAVKKKKKHTELEVHFWMGKFSFKNEYIMEIMTEDIRLFKLIKLFVIPTIKSPGRSMV